MCPGTRRRRGGLTTLAEASSKGACSAAPRDAAALWALGAALAEKFPPPRVVLLSGPLGVGKTTLAQGWLSGLGVQDRVKSPTFDLVHPHTWPGGMAYHVDLYRLTPAPPPEELDVLLPPTGGVVLVEWGEPWRRYAPRRVEVELSWPSADGEGRTVVVREVGVEGGPS